MSQLEQQSSFRDKQTVLHTVYRLDSEDFLHYPAEFRKDLMERSA